MWKAFSTNKRFFPGQSHRYAGRSGRLPPEWRVDTSQTVSCDSTIRFGLVSWSFIISFYTSLHTCLQRIGPKGVKSLGSCVCLDALSVLYHRFFPDHHRDFGSLGTSWTNCSTAEERTPESGRILPLQLSQQSVLLQLPSYYTSATHRTFLPLSFYS